MRKYIVVLVALFIVSLPVAAIAQEEEGVTYTLTMKALSRYLGTNGAIFYDGPVNQNDLFIHFPNGFYFDIWGSVGLDNSAIWKKDFDDEVDLTVGWSGEVKGLSLDVGLSYFAIVEGGVGFKDLLNPYIGVSWLAFGSESRFNLTPYLKVEHYRPWSEDALHQGWQNRMGSGYSLALTENLALGGKVGIFYDTGAFGFDRGWLSEVRGNITLKLDVFSVTPMITWIRPFKEMTVRKSNIAYGVALSRTWGS